MSANTITIMMPKEGEVWISKSRIGSEYEKQTSRRYWLIMQDRVVQISPASLDASKFGEVGGCTRGPITLDCVTRTTLQWEKYADTFASGLKRHLQEYMHEQRVSMQDNHQELMQKLENILANSLKTYSRSNKGVDHVYG